MLQTTLVLGYLTTQLQLRVLFSDELDANILKGEQLRIYKEAVLSHLN
jgi:hypothetical protein